MRFDASLRLLLLAMPTTRAGTEPRKTICPRACSPALSKMALRVFSSIITSCRALRSSLKVLPCNNSIPFTRKCSRPTPLMEAIADLPRKRMLSEALTSGLTLSINPCFASAFASAGTNVLILSMLSSNKSCPG